MSVKIKKSLGIGAHEVGVEEPVTVQGNSNIADSRTTHPAFAQISASRVSGRTVLYGSDFTHHDYIVVSIAPSELVRSNMHDHMHTTLLPYIEVAMSEAQWAGFVSSMNRGQGLPCTVKFRDGKYVNQLPPPDDRQVQFKQEAKRQFAEFEAQLGELREQVASATLGVKAKGDMLHRIRIMQDNLQANLQFAADSYGKHMEKVTEKARTEIDAHMQNAVARAGFAALGIKEGKTIEYLPKEKK